MIRRSLESVSVAGTGSMLRGRSDAIESLVSAAIVFPWLLNQLRTE